MKIKKLIALAIASTSLFTLAGCSKTDVVNALSDIEVKNATMTLDIKLHFPVESGSADVEEHYLNEYDGYNHHDFYLATIEGQEKEAYHYGYINPENKDEVCAIAKYDDVLEHTCEAKTEDMSPYHKIDNIVSIKDILENKDILSRGKYYTITDPIKLRDVVDYLANSLTYDALYGLEADFFEFFKAEIRLDSKKRLTLFKVEAITEDGTLTFSYTLKISKYGKTKIEIPAN